MIKMIIKHKNVVFAIVFIMLLMGQIAFASPKIPGYPFGEHKILTHAFGEFRIYPRATHPKNSSHNWRHEGIDLKCNLNDPVYSVASGRIIATGEAQDGYGKRVIVQHSGYQTLYAHLNKISEQIREGQNIEADTKVGYAGTTGYSFGVHLHFGKATDSILQLSYGTKQNNSVLDILVQPKDSTNSSDEKVGNAYFSAIESNLKVKPKIVFLNANTGEEINGILSRIENGKLVIDPLKIIVEAYQYTWKGTDGIYRKTNPYRIKFTITDDDGKVVPNNPSEIIFNDESEPADTDYRIETPTYASKQFSAKNYFWRYWQPPAVGIYKVQVEVYPIQQENRGVNPTDSAVREISIGVNLVDFIDNDYSFAYNPDDTGIRVSSVRALGITLAGPTIYYTNISNQIFNPFPDSDGFLNHTVFSARATMNSNWKVYINDKDGNLKKELSALSSGEDMHIQWDGDLSSGEYYISVEASSTVLSQAKNIIPAGKVIIDKDKPMFRIFPAIQAGMPSEIKSTMEGTAIIFSPNEDLSSVVINIINSFTGEKPFCLISFSITREISPTR